MNRILPFYRSIIRASYVTLVLVFLLKGAELCAQTPCSGTPGVPTITTPARTATTAICPGATFNLAATDPNLPATGLTYQWQSSSSSSGPWSSVSGGTGATTLSYTTAALSANTYFRIGVACPNSATASFSNPYLVPILISGLISAGGPTTFCNGGTVVLNAGSPNPVQWQKNGVDITGANSHNYTATTSGSYSANVMSVGSTPGCTLTTSATTVTVNITPNTITPQSTTTFCTGGSVVLQGPVPPTGTTFTYQWYLNGSSLTGATGSTYTASLSGNYTVFVTNTTTGCSATSANTTVTPGAPPSSAITPSGSKSICQNDSLTLTTNTAPGLIIQWYRNGTAIPGATGAVYKAYQAGSYTVNVGTGPSCNSTSTVATNISVNALPTATATAGGATSLQCGDSVTLSANTGTGLTYQWQLSSVAIAGAIGSSYRAKVGGVYTVAVTNANGCTSTSNAIAVTGGGLTGLYFVDSAVAASGNGLSWGAAFKTLTEALTLVNSGNYCAAEIWVKQGTYYPMAGTAVATSRDSSLRILRNGIKLYGGFNGTETTLVQRAPATNVTILSGDIGTANDSTDNAYHVVTFVPTAATPIDTASTTLDGFTVTLGNALAATGSFTVNGQSISRQFGGGIYMGASAGGLVCSPKIANCTVIQNTASYGGGCVLNAGSGGNASPVFRNSSFSGNNAATLGGGIYITSTATGGQTNPVFDNCTLTSNIVASNGAGMAASVTSPATGLVTIKSCTFSINKQTAASSSSGSALFFNLNVSAVVSKCSFNNNTAATYGGGIEALGMQSLSIDSSSFTGNTCGGTGGAVDLTGAAATVTNSTFTGNKSGSGGGIEFEASSNFGVNSLSVTNATFTNDTATASGGAMRNATTSGVTVTNTRFLNNYAATASAALDNAGSSLAGMTGCVFSGNKAGTLGGALNNVNGTAVFTNCVLESNSTSAATANGGAVHVAAGTVTFNNSTLNNNTTASTSQPNSNAIGIDAGATAVLNNTIVWGSAANQVAGAGTLTRNYSDVKGIAASGTNISSDPLFSNASNPDGADNIWSTSDDGLELVPCSPAVNTGSNALIPAGITTDITDSARIRFTTVDMGAYEQGSSGTKLYVNGAIATSGSGFAWSTAFRTLTEALTYANSSSCVDTIWVAAGTYYPTTATGTATAIRDSSFRILRNSIKLYGGFAGTETLLSQRGVSTNLTTLSGDIGTAGVHTDNTYHVLTIVGNSSKNIDTNTIVDGFSITLARNNGSSSFTANGTSMAQTDGGGILNAGNGSGNNCSPKIANCTFSNDTGTYGAAIYNAGFANGKSSPRIYNCAFINNTATSNGGSVTFYGATVSPVVSACTFQGNTAGGSGGAVEVNGSGGGTVSPSFLNCTFNANKGGTGGAIWNGGIMTVSNSSFTGNITTSGSGGAIYSQSSGLVTLIADTLVGNKATQSGGAVSNSGNPAVVTNCIFTGNKATINGGGINATNTVTLSGSVFIRDTAANGGGIYTSGSSRVTATGNFLQANVSLATGSGAGIYTTSSNDSIANNVFVANKDLGGTGGGGMNVYTGSTNTAFIANNTFYADTTAGVGGSVRLNGTGIFNVYNNLSWGNYAIGIYDVSNNTGTGAVVNISNNYFAPDPLFTNASDPDGADNLWGTGDDGLQLQSCSPAIAFGVNPPMSNYATDARGATRIQQTTVDAGAYESTYANAVTTPSVSMTVIPGTIIGTGTTVSFSATAANAGATPAYQWKKNGANVATGSTYSTNSLANGDIVTCVVTSSAACPSQATAFSESVFYTKPVVSITPSPSCTGGTDTLRSTPQPAFFNLSIGGIAQPTQYATWQQTATTVAGGNGSGSGVNQFNQDFDSKIDNNGNLYVVDYNNSRVVKWAPPYTSGVVVAGGNGAGSALNQLNQPLGLDIDGSGNLYITDQLNYRVVKWTPGATSATIVAGGNGPGAALNQFQKVYGVVVDSVGNMYISDQHNHRVTKWTPGATSGVVVAGGNGQGAALNQLNLPAYISVDKAANVYVMDQYNDRVVKWTAGAASGTVVAGGNGNGSALNQIGDAPDLFVDENGIIYFADLNNARVTRWLPGATSGTTIAAGNGAGSGSNQISAPIGIELDAAGNIYIADRGNNRVQKFAINTTPYAFPTTTAANYSASVTTVGAATDTAAAVNAVTSVTPGISIAASPAGAICSGTNVVFTATPSNGGAAPAYQWLRNGLAVGAATPTYADATLTNGSTVQVRVISNATCRTMDTAFSNIITMIVNPTPVISGVTSTNPSTCGGLNGTITINGLTSGSSYSINYSQGGVAQAPVTQTAVAGAVTLTGLPVGSYTNFSVTLGSCPSNVFAGPVSLVAPSSPAISSITSTNPTTCGGNNGSISLNGLAASATYTVNYSMNGLAQPAATLTANGSGVVTITGLVAGSYSNFYVTSASLCTSPVIAGPVVLNPPASPVISSVTPGNPTTCGGANGTITVNGLNASTAYTITYFNGSTTITILAATTTAGGSYNITGLAAGTYSSITAVLNACSGTWGSPVTLTPPATPATPTAGNNGPLCSGATLSLTATPTITGGAYSWTGPGFTSLSQNPSITNAQVTASGVYNVTVTVANCTSAPGSTTVVVNQTPATPVISSNSSVCVGDTLKLFTTATGVSYAWSGPAAFSATSQNPFIASGQTSATGTYTLTVSDPATLCASAPASLSAAVYPVPVIATSAFSSPVTCGGTSGTITLSGLNASSSYTVNYLKNSIAQVATITSNASGDVVINGLTQGTYTNITVRQNGCSSNAIASVILTDPPTPAAPSASSNSPVCQGMQLNLTASGQTGASFSWTGPNSFTSSSPTPIIASMQAVNAGTYNVTQSVAGCVSPAATTTVVISTVPAAPGTITGNANPCTGVSYTYSIGSVATATSYTWTIPSTSGWSGSSSTTSLALTTGTTSGTLSVAGVNVCGTGAAATLALNVNTAPAQPGVITGPATICNGGSANYGVVTVPNTSSYTWTLPSGWSGSTSTSSSILATASANSGNVTVAANNVCGTSTPRSLAVTVISIPAQPGAISGSATPCINATLNYSVAAVSGATAYNWTYPSGGTPAWFGASGTSSINLTIGTNSGNIAVTASNQCGVSSPSTLPVAVIQLPVQASAISGNTAPCVGAVETYSVAAVTGALSYIWTYPTSWSGAGTTTSFVAYVGTGSGSITVTPVGACGNGPSRSLAVTPTPVVTSSVSLARSTPSDTICAGTPVTFTATPVGGGTAPQYVFRKNGAVVFSVSNTYTDYSLANGDVVSVTMASSLPCVTNTAAKDSIRIIVNPLITPGININSVPPTTLCAGSTLTFTTNIVGGGSQPAYQWYKNGVSLGVTTPNYTTSALANGDTLQVTLTTSAKCPAFMTAYSNKVGLNVANIVNPTLTVTANPSGIYVPGTTVTFSLTQSGGGSTPVYQWIKNGLDVIGETGATYITNALAIGDQIKVRMQSSLTCAQPSLVVSNTIALQGPTGVPNATPAGWDGSLTLYPNPNTGHFTILATWSASHIGKRTAVDIMNAVGQLVYHVELAPDRTKWSHDVWLGEGIANGTYMLRVSAEDGMRTGLPFTLNR